MGRFLSDGNRFLRKGARFIGQGHSTAAPLAATLPPENFEGAVAYADDGKLYYSDGNAWIIPSDDAEVSRPAPQIPTNPEQASQLRLSPFRSPAGLAQTGIVFEISDNGVDFDTPLVRPVTDPFASLYQVLHPEDGIGPGDEIFWRGLYTATDGGQSAFSLPFRQVFPELITTPSPITRQNAITGTVTLSDYDSPDVFDVLYSQTEVEFYAVDAIPGVDTPITTVTHEDGAITSVPLPPLSPGGSYIWRARYGGRVNVSAPLVHSNWSASRTIFIGAASIILEYDLDLAPARTVSVPINTLANILEPLDVTIDWGDGTSEQFTEAGIKPHTYAAGFAPSENRVTVTITGRMDWYGTTQPLDQAGLVRVENIGFQMGLKSLRGAFRNTTVALTFITPNLPETVTSLEDAFRGSACAADLSGLDTRNIQSMRQIFHESVGPGPDCGGWDVRSVTDVYRAFYRSRINKPFTLGNWTNLTSMAQMFYRAYDFNQPIGYWNVSTVTSMKGMFQVGNGGGDVGFDQDIGAWDVSNVTDMRTMFGRTESGGANYNSQFNNGGSDSIGQWDVSSVTDMSYMFGNTKAAGAPFNQPIGGWETSGVTDMSGMFQNSNAFNQPIGGWNTSGVTDMSAMFQGATRFDQDLGAWDVSAVTDMSYMFARPGNTGTGHNIFNNGGSDSIGQWDVSNVTSMTWMFKNARFFDQDIGDWEVSNVTDMSSMFGARTAFDHDLESWVLRTAGTDLSGFHGAGTNVWSEQAYSRTLVSWANRVAADAGPFLVSLGTTGTLYNTVAYQPASRFANAADARAFLVAPRGVTVSGASDPEADAIYILDATTGLYVAGTGWYFLKSGETWTLHDATDAAQASGDGAFPWQAPVWSGLLGTATLLNAGAAWTIAGDSAA